MEVRINMEVTLGSVTACFFFPAEVWPLSPTPAQDRLFPNYQQVGLQLYSENNTSYNCNLLPRMLKPIVFSLGRKKKCLFLADSAKPALVNSADVPTADQEQDAV